MLVGTIRFDVSNNARVPTDCHYCKTKTVNLPVKDFHNFGV